MDFVDSFRPEFRAMASDAVLWLETEPVTRVWQDLVVLVYEHTMYTMKRQELIRTMVSEGTQNVDNFVSRLEERTGPDDVWIIAVSGDDYEMQLCTLNVRN